MPLWGTVYGLLLGCAHLLWVGRSHSWLEFIVTAHYPALTKTSLKARDSFFFFFKAET